MQIVDLQYAPGAINPVVNASQFDVGRPIKLRIFDGATPYSMPSGTTARIDGLKPDGHGFSLSEGVSVSGNEVTYYTKQQMTVVSGKVLCEIRFVNGSNTIGTLNFYMDVEPSPINENTDTSDTPLPDIIDLAERHMLAAEGYALGKQNGVDVGSSSPYYHQNSKYYKEQAAGSATTASTKASEASNSASNANTNALKSEGYAVGKQNGSSVSSGSPYYHNNAEYYAQQADASADSAEASATASSGSATQAHQEYLDAKAQADRAEAYADFLEPHFVIVDNRLCIADDAVGEFIVADNRLCMKFIA